MAVLLRILSLSPLISAWLLPACIASSKKIVTLHGKLTGPGSDSQDPELLDEYTRLLRLIRVAHILKKRYRDRQWADRISLTRQEERLLQLHKKFSMPDTPAGPG